MPQQPSDTPITDPELEGLFGELAAWQVIALAVSGGPDSLALLHLFARWQSSRKFAPTVLVLTVDHGLRPQSAAEARFVASEADGLSLPHETLLWEGPKPSNGLPKAARDARYQLMSDRIARELATPRAIVTAHTQDDQAETLLMRLARGSGVDGLAAMKPARLLSDDAQVWLVRPLLGVPKSRLQATLVAKGRTWINDPTNADLAFERPRLRQSAAIRAGSGLSNAALSLAAQRLARANEAITHATNALEASAVHHDPAVSATINTTLFSAAPLELRIRLLDRLLRRCGGSHPPARLSEIERLADRMVNGQTAATLGGCLITSTGAAITLSREPGRLALASLTLAPGESATWDARFDVSVSVDGPGPCTVRALTNTEWSALRSRVDGKDMPGLAARSTLTLPAFWLDGVLIAIPSLGRLGGLVITPRHTPCIAPASVLDRCEPACQARPMRWKIFPS